MSYKISDVDKAKIDLLKNPKVSKAIEEAAKLMKPAEVIVINDDIADKARIRQLVLDNGEEKKIEMEGHTIHYDGWVTNSYHDQARDKGHTATLLPKGQTLSRGLNVIEREEGLKEVLGFMDGAMKGKTMVVRFFCLGPNNSEFSILALQVTDSTYVAHSEDILYRAGYTDFKEMKNKDDFFYLWHSAGDLNERGNTKVLENRRIYIDPAEDRVFSVNNQYAGNSLGLKKLCLRLAINKASNEDWLAEHMFISAFSPLKGGRKTYFAGAYPSACGKTSTAMIPGGSIVGDDIAYIRKGKEGEMLGVNIEQGVFGIIRDVNPNDDPEIYKVITTPRELIFSNILIKDGKPYWSGMGKNAEYPKSGENHSGQWKEGNTDKNGKIIPLSHPNARFTIRISELNNADEKLHDPNGVKIEAVLYGGRDSDTTVPVAECLSWEHGVFVGASIESETTAATIGSAGVRKSSPMANMDFVIIPLGKYISNYIKFGSSLKECPKVYATNYFIKGNDGNYLNNKVDKKAWVVWAEGRVHGEYDAIKSPIGMLPKFEDLQVLFKGLFNEEYTKEAYVAQFSIRTTKYLEKFDRMEKLFKEEPNMPQEYWNVLKQQRADVLALQKSKGNIVSPYDL